MQKTLEDTHRRLQELTVVVANIESEHAAKLERLESSEFFGRPSRGL